MTTVKYRFLYLLPVVLSVVIAAPVWAQDEGLTGKIIWFKLHYVDGAINKQLDLSKKAYVDIVGRRNPYSVYFISENGLVKGYKLSIFGSVIPFVNFNIRF